MIMLYYFLPLVLTLRLTPIHVFGFLRVEEGHLAEVCASRRQKLDDDLQEGGPRRRPVLPAATHQIVQIVRAVLGPFHDATVDDVPEHLVVGETLTEKGVDLEED